MGIEQALVPDAPDLPAVALPVWEAFCALSRSRGYTFGGPLPIAISEMQAAFDLFDVPEDEREEWAYWISDLDGEWMKSATKKEGDGK